MMDITIRPMTPQERLYSYSQSQQITMQTSCIGHLRADMGKDGDEFWSTWDDHRADKKTEEFKAEFDEVINALRFDESFGGILKSRGALSHYCYSHPESSFGGDGREFGFRADTAQYAYLLRLNPNRGEYNLYCYCYERKWLDRHIKQAEKGIRFITPDYKELFRIPDGDKIRILQSDGTHADYTCRYIDECHLEVGGTWNNLYHICQLAEMIERNGSTVIPLRSSLPEQCYVYLPTSQEIGIVKKGEMGYYRSDLSPVYGESGQEFVNELNRQGGVNKAQAAAMSTGSMFGWQVPGANPKNYDDNGQMVRPKHRDRGEAR